MFLCIDKVRRVSRRTLGVQSYLCASYSFHGSFLIPKSFLSSPAITRGLLNTTTFISLTPFRRAHGIDTAPSALEREDPAYKQQARHYDNGNGGGQQSQKNDAKAHSESNISDYIFRAHIRPTSVRYYIIRTNRGFVPNTAQKTRKTFVLPADKDDDTDINKTTRFV